MWQVILCMIIFALAEAQQIVVTNGTSGQQCPWRRCINGYADCVNGKTCVCRPPRQLDPNNGHFGCYRNNNVFGEVYNDPEVRNMNNETSPFPFPCRYLLTSLTTVLRIRKKNVGFCKCDLHAFNLKYKGKLYVGGFDLACRINNNVLYEQIGFSTRIVGIANNGVYTYSEEGTLSYLPDGPWTSTPVDITGAGVTVRSHYDTVNNQAVMEIPECGSRITFVAYDVESRLQQQQTPGLSFTFNCALQPYFHEHDRVIATAPKRFGGQTYAELAQTPFSITEALLIRAFTSGVVQNHPGASPQCTSIGNILAACSQPNLDKTAKGCFWMWEKPKFVRCIDPGNYTEPVMELYEKCAGVHCAGTPTCNNFVSDMTGSGCSTVSGIPQLTDIVNGNFCP
ncbi:unnamed protein product [Candidula unifasciata]|uniref:VWFD domain-containing protein n=1 Tax=Candidula unifasciata TaxID=100452 RepID=A0A8S3ZJL6_9EUPU|nr:unnamed protein product [Candidula unifasciata]